MDCVMKDNAYSKSQLFVCFAAEDRYNIVQPVVYHLRNYGIDTWYDRHALLMGDHRVHKNLVEGASGCKYALIILSKHTETSKCAMEEIQIVCERYHRNDVTVFPVLFELSPRDIPDKLIWIKEIIFKEVDRHSGTREICNHIACKITGDIINNCIYQNCQSLISDSTLSLPSITKKLLNTYGQIDSNNLNSRVSILYATYLTIVDYNSTHISQGIAMSSKIFERIFSEARLNLKIDYRDIWLLENALCILINNYLAS